MRRWSSTDSLPIGLSSPVGCLWLVAGKLVGFYWIMYWYHSQQSKSSGLTARDNSLQTPNPALCRIRRLPPVGMSVLDDVSLDTFDFSACPPDRS